MQDNLVGYVLDCLDEKSKREVEAYLQAHPEARLQLLRLRLAVAPLALDKEAPTPPSDLVVRTLIKAAEYICSEQELPRAPTLSFEAPPSVRPWWRRADVLIAACLLLTVAGAVLPALLHWRSSNAIIVCQNNLRQFYTALQVYRNTQPDHSYPDVEKFAEPCNVAGMVMPMLADAGVLPEAAALVCPGVGEQHLCQLNLADLQALQPDEFQRNAPLLSQSYAYSLGYRDDAGIYHSPGHNPHLPSRKIPLMADCAPERAGANSANHGGAGQNILYADGHVDWCVSRIVGNDDVYLNRLNQVAAGIDPSDAVLGASNSRP
jgi:prepilin-type processing-associated H-X9-DG protein